MHKVFLLMLIAFFIGLMTGIRGMATLTNNSPPIDHITTVLDILAANERMKDYQVLLSLDTAYLFDNGKFVGSTVYGRDGIDSLIMLDNE